MSVYVSAFSVRGAVPQTWSGREGETDSATERGRGGEAANKIFSLSGELHMSHSGP